MTINTTKYPVKTGKLEDIKKVFTNASIWHGVCPNKPTSEPLPMDTTSRKNVRPTKEDNDKGMNYKWIEPYKPIATPFDINSADFYKANPNYIIKTVTPKTEERAKGKAVTTPDLNVKRAIDKEEQAHHINSRKNIKALVNMYEDNASLFVDIERNDEGEIERIYNRKYNAEFMPSFDDVDIDEIDIKGVDIDYNALAKITDRIAWVEWLHHEYKKDKDGNIVGVESVERSDFERGLIDMVDGIVFGYARHMIRKGVYMPIFIKGRPEFHDYISSVWGEIFATLLLDNEDIKGAYKVITEYVKEVRHVKSNNALVSYEADVIKRDDEGNIIGEMDTKPLQLANVNIELNRLPLWLDMVKYLKRMNMTDRAIYRFKLYVLGRSRETIARYFKTSKRTVERDIKKCMDLLEQYANERHLSVLSYVDSVGHVDGDLMGDITMLMRIKEYNKNKDKARKLMNNHKTVPSKNGYFYKR